MGNGQDVLMPYLNSWLKRNSKNNYRLEAEQAVRQGKHPVPSGDKELQVSQNLFLLEAGAKGVLNYSMSDALEHQLITRLKRERDEIGLWGSECTSPIYHHFIITGLSAIYHNTINGELKDLIEQNLGSFFWYAIRMGLADSKHGLIGMRGTGHDFATSGFPALHFVCQYFTSGRPTNYKQLSGWKDWLNDTGWAVAGLPGGRNYDLYKKAFEYAVDDDWTPWKLRSKLTFIRVDHGRVGHFYEKGINNNTPAMIAYVTQHYLPWNSAVRVRQRADNSTGTLVLQPEAGLAYIEYRGIYTSLTGNDGVQVQAIPFNIAYSGIGLHALKTEVLTSDLSGVSGWTQIYPSKSVPEDTPAPIPTPPREPKKRKRWWEFWK